MTTVVNASVGENVVCPEIKVEFASESDVEAIFDTVGFALISETRLD